METEVCVLENRRWFQRDLIPPPVFIYNSPVATEDLLRNGKEVTRVLNEATNTLKTLKLLEVDFVVLKRLMFKFSAVLRKHKQFKSIQQFSKCIRSFFDMNMHKVYSELTNVWSKCLGNYVPHLSASLPSKQMWQFILARTYCMVHLLTQSCSYGINALQYSYDKLQSGLFVPSNALITGCVSRLWMLCAALAGRGIEWYGILYPWLVKLSSSPMEWLHIGETLPTSLSSLQTDTQLQVILNKSSARSEYGGQVADGLTDSQMDDENRKLHSETRGQHQPQTTGTKIKNSKTSPRTEDVGEVVARNSIALKDCNTTANTHKLKLQETFPTFNKMKHLNSWLKKETVLRTSGESHCSAKLNAKQWNALQNFVKNSPKSSFEHVSKVVCRWLVKPNLYLKKYQHYLINTNDNIKQSTTKPQENSAKGDKVKQSKVVAAEKSSQNLRKRKLQTVDVLQIMSDGKKMQSRIVDKRRTNVAELQTSKKSKKEKKKSVVIEMPLNDKHRSDDIDKIFSLLD